MYSRRDSTDKDNTLTAEQIDITLKKVCPKSASLTTQQFIDFFVTLAQRLYPNDFNKAPRSTVQQIVDHFLDPIVEYINEYDSIGRLLKRIGPIYRGEKDVESVEYSYNTIPQSFCE